MTVIGSLTAVGTSDNVPSAAVIKNGNTDVTKNYDITVVNGTLTITATDEEFEISLADDEYVYDAAEHYNKNTATSTATSGTTTFSYSFTEDGEYVVKEGSFFGTDAAKVAEIASENGQWREM